MKGKENGKSQEENVVSEQCGSCLCFPCDLLIVKQCQKAGKADSGLKMPCIQCVIEAFDLIDIHIMLLC